MVDKQVPPQKARQGRKGWPVLAVLVVALLLAMIAWWGAELFGESIDDDLPATATDANPD